MIILRKILALTFTAIFLLTSVLTPLAQAELATTTPSWVAALTPSSRIGQVIDTYESSTPTKGRVVFLTDLHFNQSVQNSLIKLMKFYDERAPQAPIGLEGASGPLDYTDLARTVSPALLPDFVSFLMRSGEITGPEAYVLLSKQPTRLTGVENDKYYRYHLELFRQSYDRRMQLQQSIHELLGEMNALDASLGHNASDRSIKKILDETRGEFETFDALLEQRVTLQDAGRMARRLPQMFQLIDLLSSSLPHPITISKDDVKDAVDASLDFYKAALNRDLPLAQNTIRLLKPKLAPSVPMTIIVAGGFHLKGVTEEFKRQGISYVVVMPALGRQTEDDEALYVRRLMGGHISLDDAGLAGSGNALLGVAHQYSLPVAQQWATARRKLSVWKTYGLHLLLSAATFGMIGGIPGESAMSRRHREQDKAPTWRLDLLESNEALYQFTQQYIQARINRWGHWLILRLVGMEDLTAPIKYVDKAGFERESRVVDEATSASDRTGFDAAKSLSVSPIDITFNASNVPPEQLRKAAGMLLRGEVLHQFIMAGEASTMRKDIKAKGLDVSDEELKAMYFLDIGHLHHEPRSGMWGPRQFLQIRYQIEQLASQYPEFGINSERAVKNQMFEIHINQKSDGRIAQDWIDHNFYGFSPENVVFTPQHVNPPFDFINGQVVPAKNVEPVALGNGWPQLETMMRDVSYRLIDGRRETLSEGALNFFIDERGLELAHQYRVNDLYNLTPNAIDLPYLAVEISAILDDQEYYLARMVPNPEGPKGGIALRGNDGASLVIADTLSASDARTKAVLNAVKEKSPYHRYANTYGLMAMRLALMGFGLTPDFEIKEFDQVDPLSGRVSKVKLLNPQYVTGMLTTIPLLNSKTIMKEGEVIKDFKDLSNIDFAAQVWNEQLKQPGFAEMASPYLQPFSPSVTQSEVHYRPIHTLIALMLPLAFLTVWAPVLLHTVSAQSFGFVVPTLAGLWAFGVGLAKEVHVIHVLWTEGLRGAGLFRALGRKRSVEEFDQKTGVVSGLTGLVPVAHTMRSHSLARNEFFAHTWDIVTIPLELMHSLITSILLQIAPESLVDRVPVMNSTLVKTLKSEKLARLLPSGSLVNDAGQVVVPSLTPSSFALRLQRAFGFNATEQAFLNQEALKRIVAAA